MPKHHLVFETFASCVCESFESRFDVSKSSFRLYMRATVTTPWVASSSFHLFVETKAWKLILFGLPALRPTVPYHLEGLSCQFNKKMQI